MPAAIMIMPFLALSMFLLWWVEDKIMLLWILLPLAVYMVGIFIFRVQINTWWHKRFPPKLMREMIEVLERFFPFYAHLSKEEKTRFRNRIGLFDIPREFIPQEFPAIPEDIKTLVIAHAIQLTFGKRDFMLSGWDVIVVYKNPFISQQIKEWHAAELHKEDGVLMTSADVMVLALTKPKTAFNFVIFLMAEAYRISNDIEQTQWAFVPESPLSKGDQFIFLLSQVRDWPKGPESFYKKFNEDEIFGLAVEHFFYNPARFEQLLPDMYNAIKSILNLDPQNRESPVIDIREIADLA